MGKRVIIREVNKGRRDGVKEKNVEKRNRSRGREATTHNHTYTDDVLKLKDKRLKKELTLKR